MTMSHHVLLRGSHSCDLSSRWTERKRNTILVQVPFFLFLRLTKGDPVVEIVIVGLPTCEQVSSHLGIQMDWPSVVIKLSFNMLVILSRVIVKGSLSVRIG